MKANGIDVSKHQGVIEWEKAKADGVQFAILRAGYGREISQKDSSFERNYSECKRVGIPVGCYWYSYAMTAEEAKKEAAVCLEVIKGKQFEYPIYFDIEEKKQLALGKTACTAITKAFLDTVENQGYWVGIYSSKSHLESYISEDVRQRYAVWVAHYSVERTTYSGQFGIWQKSSSGKISGISGNVDLNESYVDYPAEIKKAGLNGFSKKSETTTSVPKAEYFTYTVKSGDTLWDIAHKYLRNGSRYKEIMFASGITSETIYVGQKLTIPEY